MWLRSVRLRTELGGQLAGFVGCGLSRTRVTARFGPPRGEFGPSGVLGCWPPACRPRHADGARPDTHSCSTKHPRWTDLGIDACSEALARVRLDRTRQIRIHRPPDSF